MKRKCKSRKRNQKVQVRGEGPPQKRMKRSRNEAPPGDSAAPQRLRKQLAEIDGEFHKVANATELEFVPTSDLRPNPRNARKHPERQIALLEGVIERFGFIGGIVIDEANRVISGHGRVEAAKRLGMPSIPCFRVSHLSEDEKTGLALADNRLAELSTWNEDVLAESLLDLSDREIGFDIEITGFDTVELDRMLGEEPAPVGNKSAVSEFSEDPADDVGAPELELSPVSQEGDVWELGDHRLIQGNACDGRVYYSLLGDERVAQVVTDPPYNVPNAGHVSSKRFREFAMAHGEMSSSQFSDFLTRALTNCASVSRDGAILHVWMDWRHTDELSTAVAQARLKTKNVCVWAKPSPGQGSFYRSQHEFIFVLKHGTAEHINNFGLGARGRTRSNLWRYPAVRGHRTGVNDPEEGHPTVKPISMMADAIRDCSRRKDIILDPFGGSGTTLLAAERTGRLARLIEIDGRYVDLTIRRWQTITGTPAIRTRDGAHFDDVTTHQRKLTPSGEVE